MSKIILLAILLGLTLATAGAAARPACAHPRVTETGAVLCCCTMPDGGSCCNWQDLCAGIVFGCFCR